MKDVTSFWVAALVAIGCAGPGGEGDSGVPDGAASVDATVVDLAFFGASYDGAEVCVQSTCGTLGVDTELTVTPAVVGSEFELSVSRGGPVFEGTYTFELSLEAIGADPSSARSSRVAVALVLAPDGGCDIWASNHEVEGTVIAATPPSSANLNSACGPFATR